MRLESLPCVNLNPIKMIEFATKEPKLFQILYMKEHDSRQTYDMLFDELGDTVDVCIDIMQKDYNLERKDAEMLFRQTWLHTFAICVLVAGEVCQFTSEQISEILSVELKSGSIIVTPVRDVQD